MKVTISIGSNLGQEVGDLIDDLTGGVSDEINEAVKTVASGALSKIKDKAAARLYRTKDQYILSLKMEAVARGYYVLTLDSAAAHLENGYASYDMKPGLLHPEKSGKPMPLNSKGDPMIKTSKKGFRYRAIPFDQSEHNAQSMESHPKFNDTVGTFGPSMAGRLASTTNGALARSTKSLVRGAKING